MNILNQKVISHGTSLVKLEKRISELESKFSLFNSRVQEESNNRMELAKSQQINFSANSFQIQTLKEKIDQISKSTNDILSQFKLTMTKDISERTSQLQNIILEKSTIFDTMDKKAQNTQFMNRSFENNLKNKLNTIETDILSSIKKISNDVGENSVKIDFLEKKQTDNFNLVNNEISKINKRITQFQNEFNILNQFKDNSNENFVGMANDIFHQQEVINEFNTKIKDQMNNFELYTQKNNKIINDEINSLIQWKEEIYKNIETINEKTVKELNQFIDDMKKEIANNKDEISLIENHVNEEQKNFGNFIQEKIGSYEININKNLEYTNEDIKTLKKDVEMIKNKFEDFKEKTFEAVNDVEKFQNKKYDDLFRILSSNNLIKNNFRYNNQIGKDNSKINDSIINNSNRNNNNLELNEKYNKNIIINEQNYNIGLSRDN